MVARPSPARRDAAARVRATVRARAAACEPLEPRRLMSTAAALSAGTLYFFETANPAVALAKVKVTGLAKREQLVGIDFRPSTGQLYGLGDSSHLYLIDPTTGRATDANPQKQAFEPALVGTAFGAGFSPVSDLLRVVSDADVNVRLYAPTGIVIDYDEATPGTQTDVAVSYADGDPHAGGNPNVQGVAYTRATDGEATAYGIDADTDSLVRLGSVGGDTDRRDEGRLTTISALGVDAAGPVGFAIDANGPADVAYAALSPDAVKGFSTLYTVDLTTGAASAAGEMRFSKKPVADVAVVPTGHAILALDAKNRLVTFDSNLPSVATARATVTGLAAKDKLVAIAARPGGGAVFAFSSQGRLYAVDPASGAATAIGAGPTDVPLRKGAKVAMDVDPATGDIRVVDSAGENLRLDAATGRILDADGSVPGRQIDTPLVYASTDVNATAKADVTGLAIVPVAGQPAGQPTSTAYAIDAGRDVLVTIGSAGGTTSPSVGQLFTVGPLGVDAADPAAIDIRTDGAGTVAFATFKAKGGKASLYAVDLAGGGVTAGGLLPKGSSPIGIVILS
jgi:hypothetical protein